LKTAVWRPPLLGRAKPLIDKNGLLDVRFAGLMLGPTRSVPK
jgi:hypothetical protein